MNNNQIIRPMKRLVLTLSILFAFALDGMAESNGFEYGLQSWTTIDGDGDGHDWELSVGGMGHNSNGMVLSYSVDPVTGAPLTPNDYLISPLLYENRRFLTFWACALETASPDEHIGIAVSTTVNNDITAFSLIQEWTPINQGNWCRYVCDLSQFVGQRKYIAIIHHNSSGNSAICIDDVYIRSDVMEAQSDLWKPFYAPNAGSGPVLTAVAQNGDLFAYGYEGLYRSQDEGETWVNILNTESFYPYYEDESGFVIGQEGRIFYTSEYGYTIYYSDDGGDTWQELFCENLFYIPMGTPRLYSPSNEILLCWSGDEYDWYDDKYLFYTLDNGETWNEADMSFITGEVGISDVIVNETGDVYVSVYSDIPQLESTTLGVYHSTLSDMQSWELVAFEGIGVKDMDFDPDGNVLCAVYLDDDFSGFEHVPGFYAFSAQNVCVSDNGIIYKIDHDEEYTTVMVYSLDHGEHFYNTPQTFILYVTYWVSPRLIKGHNNHLYFHADCDMEEYWKSIPDADHIRSAFLAGSEWYYEIQNDDGSITYQYMYQSGDTIVNDEPTQILVKINTLYDKDIHTEVTHEYIYERNGKVYWWNKTLGEFTVLYDFGAQPGDSWVTKVGTETLIMHVDAVETVEYEGKTYRMLRVSDVDDYFSGDIVCGIGHLTSFFPERLMDNRDGILVEGLRCYWIEDELVFKPGDEDCDAVISELHGVEDGPSTGSGTLTVYPNPTDGILFVETRRAMSLPDQTYRITNLMGQILMTGSISAETQQIDVSSLPQGMYFITVGEGTRKFVVNR